MPGMPIRPRRSPGRPPSPSRLRSPGTLGQAATDQAHILQRDPVTDKPVVLFLCIHNSGRSLAAKVLLDHYAQGRAEVRSAGSEPSEQLNPSVVAVLKERDLDTSKEFPKTAHRRRRPSRRCGRDHGMRRHLPLLPRQAIPRLGPQRPRRPTDRPGQAHHRRHRPPSSTSARRAASLHLTSNDPACPAGTATAP